MLPSFRELTTHTWRALRSEYLTTRMRGIGAYLIKPIRETSYKIGKRAEARRTTILQPVEQKPHSQKDKDEKAEGYAPDEGTR